MKNFSKTFAALATLALFNSGCNKPDAKTSAGQQDRAAKATAEMANMPGMKTESTSTPGAADIANMPGMKADGTSTGLAEKITMSAAQIEHGGVKWKPVAMGSALGIAIVPGELIPNEDKTVHLSAPARARILKVMVRPGDRVSVGDALITLQSAEAGMAQSDVSKAVAEVEARRSEAQYAASARARAERLLALKAIPRQDYERAIADDERARAAAKQAESELQRARTTANELSAGVGANGEIVLRASIAGVVLSRTAVPGTVVEAGSPLMVVTDASSLWLSINAPETMIAMFHRGAPLRFTVPAYPGDTLTANTESIGVGLDEQTRTLNVRARVLNRGNRLKSEMLASVIVAGGANVPAVLLPDDAVQSLQGKQYVFIAQTAEKGGAQFTRREVTVGSRNGGMIAVLHGINAGDVVVTAGAFAVKAVFQKATMPKMEM